MFIDIFLIQLVNSRSYSDPVLILRADIWPSGQVTGQGTHILYWSPRLCSSFTPKSKLSANEYPGRQPTGSLPPTRETWLVLSASDFGLNPSRLFWVFGGVNQQMVLSLPCRFLSSCLWRGKLTLMHCKKTTMKSSYAPVIQLRNTITHIFNKDF